MAMSAAHLTEDDVRRGLPVSTLIEVGRLLDRSTPELVDWLQISPRTWARRKAGGHLDSLESDRLARLVRLTRRAIDVTGGEAPARDWLGTPSPALGRRTPFEVASTEIGAERVFSLLGRLEHGVVT